MVFRPRGFERYITFVVATVLNFYEIVTPRNRKDELRNEVTVVLPITRIRNKEVFVCIWNTKYNLLIGAIRAKTACLKSLPEPSSLCPPQCRLCSNARPQQSDCLGTPDRFRPLWITTKCYNTALVLNIATLYLASCFFDWQMSLRSASKNVS